VRGEELSPIPHKHGRKKPGRAWEGTSASRGDTPIHPAGGVQGQLQQPSPLAGLCCSPPGSLLKLQLIGYFGGNVFEGHGGA
jgi:hypothetical protein